jgi:hypothetical protein
MDTETKRNVGKHPLINAVYIILTAALIFLFIVPTPGNNIFTDLGNYFSSFGGTKSPLAFQCDSASKACQITGIGSFGERNLIIPNEIEGYRVTTIGDSAMRGQTLLASVNIHGAVYAIGNYAFADCTELSKVTVENGTRIIGIGAFMNCRFLSSVYLPATLTYIGKDVFLGCDNLKEIHFGGTTEEWRGLAVVSPSNCTVYCTDGIIDASNNT